MFNWKLTGHFILFCNNLLDVINHRNTTQRENTISSGQI